MKGSPYISTCDRQHKHVPSADAVTDQCLKQSDRFMYLKYYSHKVKSTNFG